MEQVLVIRDELCDLNTYINAERSNRFYGATIKKKCTQYVINAIESNDKLEPITEKQDFSFCWYQKNKRKDPDNIAFACKFVFDGLVKSGILPNDNQAFVGRIHHTILIDKEDPRVEVIFFAS